MEGLHYAMPTETKDGNFSDVSTVPVILIIVQILLFLDFCYLSCLNPFICTSIGMMFPVSSVMVEAFQLFTLEP
jgi:hypothetical protein